MSRSCTVVSAGRCSTIVEADFHVRAIPDLAHPRLERFLRLALTDCKLRFRALALGADVLLAPLEHLDDMPAEGRAYRCRNLIEGELVHRLLEFRNGVARVEPTQIATLGSRGVFRVELRHVLELGTGIEAVLDTVYLDLGIRLGHEFIDPNEDVPRMCLVDDGTLIAAALVDQLDDVEAARAAQHRGNFAGLHGAHLFGEHGGQARTGAPSKVSAAQRVVRVGKARGDLREIAARLRRLERLFGPPTLCLDLVGTRLLG